MTGEEQRTHGPPPETEDTSSARDTGPAVGLSRLRRAAQWANLRLRIRAALQRGMLLAVVPLTYAVVALSVIKALRLDLEVQRWLLLGAVVPVALFVLGTLQAAFRSRSPWLGALALDAWHELEDRVTNALTFAKLPASERTPLMQAAIEDAVQNAPRLEPRRAVPIGLPRETWLVLGLSGALFGIGLLEVRTVRELPPPPSFEPMVMAADDIELFREMANELESQQDSPEALAAVQRFNQLIEDIASQRLDRRDVFERLAELERDLQKSGDADREALDEGLKALARELEKSGMTKAAAEALEQKRLEDAEKALRELAEKLKNKQKPPSKAELERLRQALEKASQASNERLANIEQRRRELENQRKSLLNKKKKDGDAGAQDDPKLQNLERQLERLDRDKDRAERAKRQLSKLDQELAEAARQLMQEMGESAKNLESGAEDLNRMSRQQASEEQKKELLKKLREMRELIRQQGKGGKDQLQRLMRFGQRARGNRPGQGNDGQGEGESGKSGGNKKIGQIRFGPGSGGDGIDIPMPGQGPGQGQGQQGEEGKGAPSSGKGWGTGHDANVQGEATPDLKGQTRDVTAAGIDSGQGTASAEVIYGAAERGFVGKGYKEVFTQYETVAEQVINQDEVPAGYRFYVRRYFQLIRPRE